MLPFVFDFFYVPYVSTLFLFKGNISLHVPNHCLLFHPPTDENLCCFHLLVTVNSPTNMRVQAFVLGYILRSRIAGSYVILCLTF